MTNQRLDTIGNGVYLRREVHYRNFGRTRYIEPRKDFSKAEPLFLLSDTAEGAVAAWLEEPEKWSHPTWIAVETIFQPYLAAESLLIQIGVALEALGYAIWLYEENGGVVPAGRKPSATGYFRRVAEKFPFSDLDISGERTAKAWAEAFNETYRGCKHADNPLPDGLEAHRRAKQGLNVIRCWLAKKLGVSDETLIKNKNILK